MDYDRADIREAEERIRLREQALAEDEYCHSLHRVLQLQTRLSLATRLELGHELERAVNEYLSEWNRQ